jgi:pilus assembly protein CpaF
MAIPIKTLPPPPAESPEKEGDISLELDISKTRIPPPFPLKTAPPAADPDEEVTNPGIVLPHTGLQNRRETGLSDLTASPPASTTRMIDSGRARMEMPELGPIEPFMKDPEVTEVMVNDLRNIMVEKGGRLLPTRATCSNQEQLNRLVQTILKAIGKTLDPEHPYLDAMLPDGSRVNIVADPLTLNGACITIRKFPSRSYSAEDLIQLLMMDRRIAHFLSLCVGSRKNILVSGGTGSGKTTLLNVLLSFIPRNERLVTIEDTPELAVPHFNSVRLQSKPQTPDSPPIAARELLANALRMRPDRIIIGECRRSEAFDMLQAMNTGHEGSMTSLHANSPRDTLHRLETLCMTAGVDLPLLALRRQIQSSIDLIVQCRRFANGARRIMQITEVTGMEGDTVTLQDIFAFDVEAQLFKFTGFVPTFVDSFKDYGFELPKDYFA